MNITTYR